MLTHEVVVDPFLLCLPNPCNSLEELEDFIHAIVGWRGFLDRKETQVLLSDSVRIALNDDNEFPHRHKLSELIKKFDCSIADANTISKIATAILERTPTLEDHFGIDAVLADDKSFACEPELILDRLKDNCRDAFKDDLIITGIQDNVRSDEGEDPSLMVASGLGGALSIPELDAIEISADIHDFESAITIGDGKTEFPISISLQLPIVFSHEQLLGSLDLWAIWDGASSEEAVCSCIDTCVRNLIDSGVSEQAVKEFIIGDGFVESLHKWGASSRHDYAMVTVESCARIVLGIPKNPVNEFRETSEGSSKQRSREDGALAFRTHLTKKGVGLRLMFWHHTDGTIEFANIGGKGELEIV
ncbi:MAG: hypothetical protein ABW162_12195 [Candidatus Sedimenticola sp. PURPLELP]